MPGKLKSHNQEQALPCTCSAVTATNKATMKRTIRDSGNRIKGYMEGEGDRQNPRVYDEHNVLAGWYMPGMNRTYDAHGRIVGMGDQRLILLKD
jgi:hypothetical protein